MPFGAQHHLCRFPVQYVAPSASTSTGSMPGTWAASTSTSMPRVRHAATMSAIGNTSPVALVTWSITTSRVRAVNPPVTASSTCAGPAIGSGSGTSTYDAPHWRARNCIALATAR